MTFLFFLFKNISHTHNTYFHYFYELKGTLHYFHLSLIVSRDDQRTCTWCTVQTEVITMNDRPARQPPIVLHRTVHHQSHKWQSCELTPEAQRGTCACSPLCSKKKGMIYSIAETWQIKILVTFVGFLTLENMHFWTVTLQHVPGLWSGRKLWRSFVLFRIQMPKVGLRKCSLS
jgi:hypothetical protein